MIAVTALIRMIHAASSVFAHHGPFPFQSFHISTPPSSVLPYAVILYRILIFVNSFFCFFLDFFTV